MEHLTEALNSGSSFGVWGRLTERERRALLRRFPGVDDWGLWLERESNELTAKIHAHRAPHILAQVRCASRGPPRVAGFQRLATNPKLSPMTASSGSVSTTPTTWEYAIVPFITHATKQTLDQQDADGWELVRVVPGLSSTDNLIAYLKRPRF